MNAQDPSPTPNALPHLLAPVEVARQLNITERALADARQAGKIGCIRLGRVVRHSQAQVDAYIAACTVEAVV